MSATRARAKKAGKAVSKAITKAVHKIERKAPKQQAAVKKAVTNAAQAAGASVARVATAVAQETREGVTKLGEMASGLVERVTHPSAPAPARPVFGPGSSSGGTTGS
ncbi:MAG: hypothetical protein ACHQTF_09570 [Gemmatimonadales bacterium]